MPKILCNFALDKITCKITHYFPNGEIPGGIIGVNNDSFNEMADLKRLPALHLPPARLRVEECADGLTRVFDPLRRRAVALTPEEWVRQHFVAHLVERLGYPPALLANEVGITLNGTSRRCDTVLYSPEGLRPEMIVEYKAPHIAITQKVFDQIVRYNMVLRVPWLIVSNGMAHYCCRVDYQTSQVRFLPEIPTYAQVRGNA